MRVCKYCFSEVIQKQSGDDDSLDYCEVCDMVVEGNTLNIQDSGDEVLEFCPTNYIGEQE